MVGVAVPEAEVLPMLSFNSGINSNSSSSVKASDDKALPPSLPGEEPAKGTYTRKDLHVLF
jgi:hypothetical protein